MKRFTAVALSLLLLLTCSGITASAQSTEKASGVPHVTIMDFINAIINKDEIIATEHTGEVSNEAWNADDTYSAENTAVIWKN